MEFVRKEEKVSEAVPLQKAVVEEARMAAKNQSPLSNAENAVEMRLRFRHGENLPLSKVSGVRALPSRIICGSSTNLHILLKERMPSVDGVELEFTQPPQPSTFIAAQTVNPYTVCCKAPDMPPGSVEVTIRCNGVELARACLKYYTQMEELCDLLRTSCEPVSFMCQAYNIIPYDANRLDALLAESLCNNSTHQVLHLFAPGPVCAEEKLRREELPTLLHFAARYGFCKLATELLHLPGAFQAYSALNCHGFYPNNLASANGFQDFRHFLDNTVNEISDICTSETMKHESCLKYQENNPENVYEDMKAFLPTIRPSSRVKHSVNMQHSQRRGQEWLICLQEQVKAGDLSIDEARLLFGEWKLNQQQRCTSLRLHEEALTRIRDSIARRQQQQKEYGACKGAWCISDPEKYNLMNRVPHCAQSLQKDMKKGSTSAVSDFDDWYSSVSNSNNSQETNTECNECVWDLESAPQFHLPSHQSSLESTKLASSREATQPHDNEPKTSSTLKDQSSLLQPISFISPKFTALSKLSSENCPALPIPKPRKSLEHLPPAKKL